MKRLLALAALLSASLVLCALLTAPVAAQDAGVFAGSPTDFLPLQVGNQWTFMQEYRNPYYNRYKIVEGLIFDGGFGGYDPLGLEWTRIRAAWEIPGYPLTAYYEPESPLFDLLDRLNGRRELTLEITHTEMIEGHAYFVFSDPADGVFVPALCLAGQKVRFSDEGVLLVRRQEQDVPLYDFSPPYTPRTPPYYIRKDYTTKDYTTPAYPVFYDGHYQGELPLTIRRTFFSDQAFVACFEMNRYGLYLGRIHFLPGYGLALYILSELPDPWTGPSGSYKLYLISAVIDGQVLEYPYLPNDVFPGYTGSTHVQPTSWGQLKARLQQRP